MVMVSSREGTGGSPAPSLTTFPCLTFPLSLPPLLHSDPLPQGDSPQLPPAPSSIPDSGPLPGCLPLLKCPPTPSLLSSGCTQTTPTHNNPLSLVQSVTCHTLTLYFLHLNKHCKAIKYSRTCGPSLILGCEER